MVGSGTRNARAISSVVRPPSRRSVSATRASVDSTGWQAVNISRSRSSPTSSSSAASRSGDRALLLRLELVADLLVLAFEHRVAAEAVDRAVLCGRHQPRARIVGHARQRPLFERGDQRVLREILGEADVADDARQPRDDLRRFDAPDGVDRSAHVCAGRSGLSISPREFAMSVGSRHGSQSHQRDPLWQGLDRRGDYFLALAATCDRSFSSAARASGVNADRSPPPRRCAGSRPRRPYRTARA